MLPVVRYLIACDDVIVLTSPLRVTLINVIGAIRSQQFPPFPLRRLQLCVYAQLTNARGSAVIWIRVVHVDDDEIVMTSQKRRVQFGSDPLETIGVRFRILDCLIPRPGMYQIELWCENEALAHQLFIAR